MENPANIRYRPLKTKQVNKKILGYKGELQDLVRSVGKMLLDSLDLRTQPHGTIASKDVQAIREIIKKFRKSFEDIKIDLDESDVRSEIASISGEMFKDAVKKALDEKNSKDSSGRKQTIYKKGQLDEFFTRQPKYIEAKDTFVYSVKDTIIRMVDGNFPKDYEPDQKVVDAIAKIIVSLHEKIQEGKDAYFLKELQDHLDLVREGVRNMVADLQKDHEKETPKLQKYQRNKNNSLFQAFRDTVIVNSKTYTRNVNLVRDVFLKRTSERLNSIRKFTEDIKRKMIAPVKTISRSLNNAIQISRAFGDDLGWFAEGGRAVIFAKGARKSGLILMAKSLKSFLGRTVRLGAFGLYGGIRILSNTVSFAFSAISNIGKFVLNVGIAMVSGIAKTGKRIASVAFGAIGGIAKGITSRLRGLYSFIKNNTLLKRIARFFKTDAGAVFLGSLAAFAKVFIVNPILERFKIWKNGEEESWEEPPVDPNQTEFGNFLNRHQNLAEMIFEIRKTWISIQNMFSSAPSAIDALKESMKSVLSPFEPYIDFLGYLWNVISSAGKLALRYKFTTIALRGMKGRGGFLANILGFAVGFLLDTFLGSTDDGKTTEKDGKFNVQMDENILKHASRPKNLSDKFFGLSIISKRHKGQQNLGEIQKKYLDLMNELENEEESIGNVSSILDSFQASDQVENLVYFLKSPQMDSLLRMAGSMEMFGLHETVPGSQDLPDGFSSWDKENQIKWFRNILEYRTKRLERIRHSLRSFGERGFNQERGDVQRFLERIRKENLVEAYSREPQKHTERVGTYSPKNRLFGNVRTVDSVQYKVAKFQGLATTLASGMTRGTRDQRDLLKKTFLSGIEDISNKALSGDETALSNLEKMVRDLDSGKMESTQEFLLDEVKNIRDRDPKASDILSDLDLMDQGLFQGKVIIDIDALDKIRNEIKKKFLESNGIEQDFDDVGNYKTSFQIEKDNVYSSDEIQMKSNARYNRESGKTRRATTRRRR